MNVYCTWCNKPFSGHAIRTHEPACPEKPGYIAEAPAPPLPPGHVPRDHFRQQFIQHGDEAAQLDGMARHCSMLYNQLQDEKRLRLASYRDIVQRLSDANPMTELALSLNEAACEMEE